jgi:hypothetical protein
MEEYVRTLKPFPARVHDVIALGDEFAEQRFEA